MPCAHIAYLLLGVEAIVILGRPLLDIGHRLEMPLGYRLQGTQAFQEIDCSCFCSARELGQFELYNSV